MADEATGRAELPPGLYDDLVKEFGAVKSVTRQVLGLLLTAGAQRLGVQDSAILVPRSDDTLGFLVSTNTNLMQEGLPPVPINGSIAGLVFVSAQTMSFDQADSAPQFFGEIDKAVGYRTKEYLAAPIVADAEVLGVLTFVNRKQGLGSFDKKEMLLADKFASAAAIVMEHIEKTRRQVGDTLEDLNACFTAAMGPPYPGARPLQSQHKGLRSEIVETLQHLEVAELELIRALIHRFENDESELVI